jgi:hypothetical protein
MKTTENIQLQQSFSKEDKNFSRVMQLFTHEGKVIPDSTQPLPRKMAPHPWLLLETVTCRFQ